MLALVIFLLVHSNIAITPEEQCDALDGANYNYCPDTGIYYCCGVNNDGYGCGQAAYCSSNSGLQYCACTNGELRPETQYYMYSRSDLLVDDSADGSVSHIVIDLDQD